MKLEFSPQISEKYSNQRDFLQHFPENV